MKRVLPFLLLILGLFTGINESWSQIPGLPNRWNSVSMPNLDTAVVAPATFTVGGKTYLVGGDTSGDFGAHKHWTKQVWVYTHATNSWSKTTPFPGDKRLGAVAFGSTSTGKGYYGLGYDTVGFQDTAFRNKFYDTMGYPVFQDTIVYWHTHYFKDWWEFDTATVTWTRKKDFPIADIESYDTLPGPLAGNGIAKASSFSIDTVVNLNGNNYNFAGGFIFGEKLKITWDSTKGNPTPPGYGDTRWDGAIYSEFNLTPYYYNAAQDSFYSGTNFPDVGRRNAVAMILDGSHSTPGRNPKLYCGLGENGTYNLQLLNVYFKDWYSYDFATSTWKNERPLPDTGKASSGAFSYEHLGMVVCGFDGDWVKNFFIYNTEDDDWERYPDYRDSGRSLGSAFAHGNRGFYGAGFRGNSDELKTFSWYNIDTATIRLNKDIHAGDTFCAGSDLIVNWFSTIPFNNGAVMKAQISDKDGVFEWPVTSISDLGVAPINGDTGTVNCTLPKDLVTGKNYRIRVYSSSPFYISRITDSFYVKENPKFTYSPKIYPFLDTICLNANFYRPMTVTGSIDTSLQFTYNWLFNGDTMPNRHGKDLFIFRMQFKDSGHYRLVAQGDCYADTSKEFHVILENIPPPVIHDDLDYPGMIGDTLYLCEYDTNTFYIDATGKNLHYQWFRNGIALNSRDNIQGLGGPVIHNLGWNLGDSGMYKVQAIESCGAYTESDSILVKMRAIPRIERDPFNVANPPKLEGETAQFWVKASGYKVQYHWRKDANLMKDSGRISGTDQDTLTIMNLIPFDVAFYSCIVTGGCPGFSDTSNLAIVDLNASPTIIKQPTDTLKMCEGTDNSITIIAAGTNLHYNWQYVAPPPELDTNMFKGVKTRELDVVNAQVGKGGLIQCKIDNGAGASVLSDPVYLIIIPTPDTPKVDQFGPLLKVDQACETYIWFENGVWKGQYNTQTIRPTEEGDYSVRVICKGCPSPISNLKFFISSVVRADLQELDMYPNPASSSVLLDLPGITAENPATVRVYDLQGKLIQTIQDVRNESYEVNLNGLSKGMYIVHVSSANVSFSGKLVKE
ncbi:MAG: T9SS type A sorting domain-containing protein [Bacteroidetes bacterium]|nr:T9SS type A sorting domain-containing protein [Bacteroidota bacterium]